MKPYLVIAHSYYGNAVLTEWLESTSPAEAVREAAPRLHIKGDVVNILGVIESDTPIHFTPADSYCGTPVRTDALL